MPGTEREVRVPMADGVRLAATLYLPDSSAGPQPAARVRAHTSAPIRGRAWNPGLGCRMGDRSCLGFLGGGKTRQTRKSGQRMMPQGNRTEMNV